MVELGAVKKVKLNKSCIIYVKLDRIVSLRDFCLKRTQLVLSGFNIALNVCCMCNAIKIESLSVACFIFII